MNRLSIRIVLAGVTACLIGGTALSAAADGPTAQPNKDHTICLINQDSSTGPQHGLCVTIPLP
ncbi:MAG: hypothetical protein JWM40_1046 [Frankiales bacterium]|nr:hypothetical protein [Frankiales bacterium]